jgi:serine/threonine protein kinase
MDVAPGTRFGPYEVVSRLGAGGMGEVYRARDTRLDRSVAIKVLPSEFARNAQLRLRFEREARSISQLSHPNICTLYDVGDGYLVMELLEGETLADRIRRGPLPVADVLRYGAQIADALDRAHRAGIIHRDLKPANIMITRSGAKLLDFGLAKAGVQRIDPDDATVRHQDPSITQEGTVLGTFQYMAPEQLEGEEADARTDLFAFGAVLYEMLTGTRAFQGKTRTSLIAAIVGTQPAPVSHVVPLAPTALDHIVRKALEKDRDDRWQSAHDVAEQLRWLASTPQSGPATDRRPLRLALGLASLLALALLVMTTLVLRSRAPEVVPATFVVHPPEGRRALKPFLSPDGTMIAFSARDRSGTESIFLRRLADLTPKTLVSGPQDSLLGWSPDSRWIAYATRSPQGSQIRKLNVADGSSEHVANVRRVVSLDWGRDGTLVHDAGVGLGLFAILPDGTQRSVTRLDAKRRSSFHTSPEFLGDGKRFLYVDHTVAANQNEIRAGSIDGSLDALVMRADALVGLAQGHLFFVREGAIYAQPFDEGDLRVSGTPRLVAPRVNFHEPDADSPASVSDAGALAYIYSSEAKFEWGWYDRKGQRVEKVFEGMAFDASSLSPDHRRVAAMKFDPAKGADDIWIVDLERGLTTKLTSGRAFHASAVWSPAGDEIYFTSDRDGPYDIYVQSDDGSAPARLLLKSPRDKQIADITPDGKSLIVLMDSETTGSDLWLVPIAAPQSMTRLISTEGDEVAAAVSPDGNWIAYRSNRSGRDEMYVRHLRGGRVTQVSTEGSTGAVWSRDGRELLIRARDNSRWAVPLTYEGNVATPGKPRLLFPPPSPRYAILMEGEKGLFIITATERQSEPFFYQSGVLTPSAK